MSYLFLRHLSNFIFYKIIIKPCLKNIYLIINSIIQWIYISIIVVIIVHETYPRYNAINPDKNEIK